MKKTHQKQSLIVYGINPVTEAIVAGQKISKIWLDPSTGNKRLQNIKNISQQKNIPIQQKTADELFNLVNAEHQGVVAFLAGLSRLYSSLEDFFHQQKPEPPYLFMILDNITDPRNLGALMRSADHFAVTALVIPKHDGAPLSSVVFKTSSGAIHHLPVIQQANLHQAILYLKKNDTWVYGLDAAGDKNLSDCDLKGNIAIVLGSEGKGMRRLVRESCDFLVNIKNLGHVDSLNVSVAGGITLYEAMRQRSND